MAVDSPVEVFNSQLVNGRELQRPVNLAVEHVPTYDRFSGATKRQRMRDPCFDQFSNCIRLDSSSSTEEQISSLIRLQQIDIGSIFAEHTKKLRLEIEERRIQHDRTLASLVSEGIAKRIYQKDMEVRRMGGMNWLLQEKVERMCEENRMLRDSAMKKQADVNSLQRRLDQVLADYSRDHQLLPAAVMAEDAGSYCCNENERVEIVDSSRNQDGYGGGNSGYVLERYKCKKCGEREASVLLLPCRHLSLCSICGSTLLTCPLCNAQANGSIRVNNS